MTFEVKYRNKQGATEFLRVDAASRSEVFAILKERGIPSAIQVTDVTGKKPCKGTNAGAPMSGSSKGLLALVAVCVIGAVAYLIISQDAPKPTKPAEKKVEKKSIEVVAPEIVEKVEIPKVEVPKFVTNRHGNVVQKKSAETYTDDRGVLRYKNGDGRVPLPDAHKYLIKSRTYVDDLPAFKHQVESEIATLITLQPGEMLIGDMPHGRAFEKDFVNAIMEPVEILEDDSEEHKKLKQDVEEIKRELAERLKQGENVGDILQEARDELRRMANYKNEVMAMVREQIAENAQTTDDVDAYYAAMNKMLEEKGIEPVKMSGLMRRKIGYDIAKAREAEAKAAATTGSDTNGDIE